MRAVATDALTTLGFDIVGVEHGDAMIEAIRLQPSLRLTVINIDMMLSTGLEVLREARAIRPELRALIITGHPDIPEDFVDHRGNTAVLRMPFRIGELADSIFNLMALSRDPIGRFPGPSRENPD
jgi:DNA-binding NtrC family response regulator